MIKMLLTIGVGIGLFSFAGQTKAQNTATRPWHPGGYCNQNHVGYNVRRHVPTDLERERLRLMRERMEARSYQA